MHQEDLDLARCMKDLELSGAKKGKSGSISRDSSAHTKVSVLGLVDFTSACIMMCQVLVELDTN